MLWARFLFVVLSFVIHFAHDAASANPLINTTDKTLVYGIQAVIRAYDINSKNTSIQEVKGYTEVKQFKLPNNKIYLTNGSVKLLSTNDQTVYAVAMQSNMYPERYILAVRGESKDQESFDKKFAGKIKLVALKNLDGKTISNTQVTESYEELSTALGQVIYPFLKQTNIEELQIVGHGLGGAVAQLMSLKIAFTPSLNTESKNFITRLTSVGAPRYANFTTTNYLEKILGDIIIFANTKNDKVVNFPALSASIHSGYADNSEFLYNLCFTDCASNNSVYSYLEAVNNQLDKEYRILIKGSTTFVSCD